MVMKYLEFIPIHNDKFAENIYLKQLLEKVYLKKKIPRISGIQHQIKISCICCMITPGLSTDSVLIIGLVIEICLSLLQS